MHKSKIKQITLAVCLALLPFSGFAAGLGKLNVSSGLGEPLKAEIELLSVTPEELSTLVAAIASEEAYTAQGVTRLAIHNNIKVEVAKAAGGAPILKLRTTQPISDPYLDMLIQVDWASGRLQREYTVLLDPPGYKEPVENAVPMAITSPSANANTRTITTTTSAGDISQPTGKKSKKSRTNSRQVPVATPAIETELSGNEITTKPGDTLNGLARQLQVEGVSLDQMLAGLYESNKDAFAGSNMNRLKVGQIIKVPTKESLAAIDAKDAHQQVKVQTANWNAYRNKLAGTVDNAPAMADGEQQKQTAAGKISTTEDKAASAKTGPQDVVKLSGGDKAKAGSGAKEFEAKITALQEEATAREKSLKEAQERTVALEKQIQDMRNLLALKNQTLANAQKNAEAAKPPVAVAQVKVAEAPPAATPAPAVVIDTKEPAKAADAPKAEPTPATVAPEVKPAEPKVADKKVVPTVVAVPTSLPVAEPSFLQSLMNGIDLTIIGGVGGLALLAAGWMFLRNKRRKDLDSFERGILTSGGLRANTVFGNTTGNASTSDTSFLTDFAQSADGSMIDTNDVDPIAEAEVYMAYGRDAQAEEILKDAISKEPKRYELHLKLLEMYAARKDTSAFEAIAGELYTTLGADDPTWAKVAEIGAAMEPENPLYDVSKVVVASTEATQKLDISDFANVQVSDFSDLDFSLNADAPVEDANSVIMQSFASANDTDKSVSFDVGSLDESSIDELPVEPSFNETMPNLAASPSLADNAMDFDMGDFDLGTINSTESETMKTMDNLPAFDMSPVEAPVTAFAAPSFDMGAPFDTPASTDTTAAEKVSSDFDMNFKLPADTPVETSMNNEINANEISFDVDMDMLTEKPSAASGLDSTNISFDLPEMHETTNADDAITMTEAPNHFDLSTISLDLTESADETANELGGHTMPAIALTSASAEMPESEDVNIKLDLVSAYIDMGDKEGARELLEEVVKEGSVQQQMRAQQLLSSLS